MKRQKRFLWIKIITLLAIIVSSYLIYEHYRTTPSKFCNFGNKLNCDVVNKSPYSNIDGIFFLLNIDLDLPIPLIQVPIPLALISFFMFLFILKSISKIQKRKKLFGIKPKSQLKLIKYLMILSIITAVYLIAIEMFILYAYCIFCTVLDILILIDTILIFKLK
jgi:uncharacterized membrane protein